MEFVSLEGDWDMIRRFTSRLKDDISEIVQKSVTPKIALKIEQIAVDHVQKQDLGWEALSSRYAAKKDEEGLSEKILVATSTYFQNITSFTKDGTAYAGVLKTARTKDGERVGFIANVLEYGSQARNIPARPLWRPSYDGFVEWLVKSNFVNEEIRRGLSKKYNIAL